MDKNEIMKVHITYNMVRGKNNNESAETCVELPISKEKYDQLVEGLNEMNSAWADIKKILATLTKLQGYKKLGYWAVELKLDLY